MVLRLLDRFRRGRIVATIPTEIIETPEYDRNLMEFIEENSVCFSGWDSLELYWDPERDKLVFRQEFGGINELDDRDIERLMDLCMRYLRR